MTVPTHLLAKFIPDLQRMEPRNIGVIFWTPERTAARFLFEKAAGVVDGRAVLDLIAYWRESVSHSFCQPATGGAAVDARSPEFIQAIQSANRGQSVLVEGRVLLDGEPAHPVVLGSGLTYANGADLAPEGATPERADFQTVVLKVRLEAAERT